MTEFVVPLGASLEIFETRNLVARTHVAAAIDCTSD